MSRRHRKKKGKPTPSKPKRKGPPPSGSPDLYGEASALAEQGHLERASTLYRQLEQTTSDHRKRALIRNDLAVLSAVTGDAEAAVQGLEQALVLDSDCQPARVNLALLRQDLSFVSESPPAPHAPVVA